MMEYIIEQIHAHPYWFWLGYLIPVGICLFGYLAKIIHLYRLDKAECKKQSYYPSLTIGYILGRLIVSFIPLVNLSLALFKFFPEVATDFFAMLENVFNFPLVKKKYVPDEKRIT